MKVSNSTVTKASAYCLLALALTILLSIVFVQQTVVNILLTFSSCIIVFLLCRLKSVTYELSGECLTIRKSHPFSLKKYVKPDIEFPQNYISDYRYGNGLTSRVLKIKIKTKRDRKFEIRLVLFGFSDSQKEKINTSLQSVVARNNMTEL